MYIEYCYGPKWPYYSCDWIYCIYWTVWDRICRYCIWGRDPRTKETLPDFLKWRRVTRRPLVFRGLTGHQRTPEFWSFTRDTSEKVSLIRQRLLMAQSRQKSYAYVRRRPLEFEVGNHVFLKVIPKRGVVRFGKRGKLSPRFIGPFELLERVDTVPYRLALRGISCLHAPKVYFRSNSCGGLGTD